jgi:hypothetical protein
MPRLNSRGDVVQGLGLVWLSDELLIGQREQPDGSWAVSTAPAIAGPWMVVVHRGCNFIAAGAENWAAQEGSLFGPGAIPDAGAGLPAGQEGRGAAAFDGTIALVADFQAGKGLILHRRDGSRVTLPDAYPTSNCCVVDRDRALWVDAMTGGVRTCGGLPVPLTVAGPVLWPAVFWALDGWWVAYHSTDAVGYICHPFDSLDGYRIALPPAFYPNAVAVFHNVARLAWSLDPAESPGGLRVHDQDLTLPRVPLAPTVPPEPPEPTPEPPEPEPGPEPPEPTPVPPQPIPAPFRRHLKGTPVDTIDGKIVLLRGPAGLLACPDAPNTGTWGSLNQGWRGFRWLDAHSPDATAQHRCTKVGDRYTFTNLGTNGLAGADATKHSGSIPQQFYYKPDGNTDAGDYELWQVYTGNANGALQAQIEYSNDEGRYFACSLAVEVVG